MNFTKLKTERAILARLPEEFDASEAMFKDGDMQSLTLRGPDNEIIFMLQKTPYGGMEVLVLTPPKLVTKWKLAGTYLGLDVCETRDTEFDAQERKQELANAWNIPIDNLPLKIYKVEVPEEDA